MDDIRVLIVDDEQPARKKIRTFLAELVGIGSIMEAENGAEAVRLINEELPDLVLLDIQMPGMNGFEVIRTVGAEAMPAVVFVTAYDHYAVAAFEVHAIDYLMKPFDRKRFQKSFDLALERIHSAQTESDILKKLLTEINKNRQYARRITVNEGSRLFFMKVSDIVYVSSCEKYIEVHTETNTYMLRETMNGMEALLDPATFVRIHRSTIVNIDFITVVKPWFHGDCIAVVKTGEELKISRRYRDRLIGGEAAASGIKPQ